MEIYEDLLSMEISRITQEHDAFWSNLLFDQGNDFNSNYKSFAEVHVEKANINQKMDIKRKTKQQNGKTSTKNRRSTSDIDEPAAIYMENNEKVRTCQDMSGVLGMLLEILTLINPGAEYNIKWYVRNTNECKISIFFSGGTNAFHFLSFVAGVLTLIVNVNNNINNNNVNVNGINANANSNQNSDANVNNNAANVIMVMPGKKRKKK